MALGDLVLAVSEKQIADHVLQTLKTSRYTDRNTAVRELTPLREMVGQGDHVERERADAWLAISVLHDGLRGSSRDLDGHWDKAIEKTEAWQAALR